jgi:hypothetical protein
MLVIRKICSCDLVNNRSPPALPDIAESIPEQIHMHAPVEHAIRGKGRQSNLLRIVTEQ